VKLVGFIEDYSWIFILRKCTPGFIIPGFVYLGAVPGVFAGE